MTTFAVKQVNSESLHARIPQSVLENIDHLAHSLGRSRNWVFNDALKQYVETQQWQIDLINKRLVEAKKSTNFISHTDILKRQKKRLREKLGYENSMVIDCGN